MLGFISKNILRRTRAAVPPSLYLTNTHNLFSTDSTAQLESQIDEPVKEEIKVQEPIKDSTFTISYLVKSCGLTPESAQNACKLVNLKSANRSDKVLNLLRENGFTDANITRLVERRPSLVAVDPRITLKPKFEFFSNLGAPKDVTVKMLLEYPEILNKSLDKSLIPSVEFLKSFLLTNEKVCDVIVKYHGILRHNVPYMLGANVKILRDEGVGDSLIAEFLHDNPHLMMTPAARFAKIVDKVRDMGVDFKRCEFVEALSVISSFGEKEWDRKVNIFTKWGWSVDDLNAAFSKQPKCMTLSDKKIEKLMEYLVKTMELDPTYLAKNANVLMLNLKSQIIPRYSLIRYLLKMGVISKEDFDISVVLESKEEAFIRGFIKKHRDVLPELLDLYTFCKKCAATGRSQPI